MVNLGFDCRGARQDYDASEATVAVTRRVIAAQGSEVRNTVVQDAFGRDLDRQSEIRSSAEKAGHGDCLGQAACRFVAETAEALLSS